MQSGIRASEELHRSFNELLSSPSQRGLLVGIRDERLVPLETIPSTSADFSSDLSAVVSRLKDDNATYVILRRYSDVPDGLVAVTYVPDIANVRQKTLYASTRLSMVKELGTERFRETLFATTKEELTAEGFHLHDKHGELKAPLTQEEQGLEDIKEAEATASRGTAARSSHVSSGVMFPITNEALRALKDMEAGGYNLVQLMIDVRKEQIELAATSQTEAAQLATAISEDEPRYSFFRYQHDFHGQAESPVIFIYTCPSGSKVKERMLYASSRAGVIATASSEAGLTVGKRLEASSPSEITETTIHDELHPHREEKAAFSRPKRPGKR
ncbi:MAG: Twinfilin-1 [Thelocarpon impressellum]|nr:MAG: Twinfilin-1 [Thelocarpon impressellum]